MVWASRALLFGSLVSLVPAAFAQGEPAVIDRIIQEGRDKSQAFRILTSITQKVGSRVTGSRALDRGLDWAIKEFKRVGVDNVWKEEWGVVPETFDRGSRQSVRMVSPYATDFVFTTPCWTNGTKGKVKGPIVKMPATKEEFEKVKASLKGAWVLMPQTVGMGGPNFGANRPEVCPMLDGAGIAGRVYSTGREIVWTGGGWNRWTKDTRPATPLVVVRKSDFDVAALNVDRGRQPVLEAEIENIIRPEPIKQYNIVAEIRGSEKPDEVVIVCGHFDSWNGPGSQGACDNGTGSMATLECARILASAKARPKRTVRFILWTGEEQGLLGSAAYVRQHAAELGNIQALLNEDSGQNRHAAIVGLDTMMPILEAAVAPMKTAFEGLPVEARQVPRMPRGGSDHGSFVVKGVPAFFLVKGEGKPYSFVWHTQNDRLEHTEELWLRQMSTNLAVLSYNLACSAERLPAVPVSATVYDPHASVGGYFEDEHGHQAEPDHTCPCGLPAELKYRAKSVRFSRLR